MLEITAKDKLVVGVKQTSKAISEGRAQKVYVARDAEQRVTKPILELAHCNSVEVILIDTMREVGKACNIDVGAATAVLLK